MISWVVKLSIISHSTQKLISNGKVLNQLWSLCAHEIGAYVKIFWVFEHCWKWVNFVSNEYSLLDEELIELSNSNWN